MSSFLQDVRFAFRQLRQSAGFTALAIITLAFGIGANTAMFTVVQSVLIRPLPYLNADRLVFIGPSDKDGFTTTSWLNYRDIREQATDLESVGCYSEDVGVVQGKDGSQSVVTPALTPSVFWMLGTKPLLGRTFSAEEGQAGGPSSVILSEGIWRDAFNADPQILGTAIRVNGQPRVVVGVMPRSFRFPESIGNDLTKGVWLAMQPTAEMTQERGYSIFMIVANLKRGVNGAQAQAELASIAKHIQETDSHAAKDLAFRVTGYQSLVMGPAATVLLALTVALGLVLLIACANVANMLIARCLARQHEFAIRAAIGANGARLARQLIVEGGALSTIGTILGFLLAYLGVLAIHQLPPDTIPRSQEIAVNWTVVAILAAMATATTLLSTLLPALVVAGSDPQKALQAGSRGAATGSIRGRLSGSLVIGEVALSVLLLVATGLLFRTLWNLEHVHLGFEVSRVSAFSAMPGDAAGFGNLSVQNDSAPAPPSIAVQIYAPVLDRLRQLPGIQQAALVTSPPLSGIDLGTSFDIVGKAHDREHRMGARITAVSGEYTHLMATPLLRGRPIADDDAANAAFVIVVNETLVRKYFAGIDPIGQQLDLGGKDTGMAKPYTIVGVVGDQVDVSVSQEPQPLLMIPYQQVPTTSLFYQALIKTVVNFVVKTSSDVAVAGVIRPVFKELAPGYALDNFRTMQRAVDDNSFNQRLGLYLTGAFASLAVLMVIAGLYGVLSQLASYRRREFGIRLALGATPLEILWMVLRQALAFVAAGLAAGFVVALIGVRFIKGFLYGVQPADATTIMGVVLVLLLVGSAAAAVPARRAAATEPIRALREE